MIPHMTITHIARPTHCFTLVERRALQALRRRYQQDLDLFTEIELAHLHFVSWLCETGRLFR